MNDYIREVADYIISGHTVSEAAIYFDKSISSIKKYLAKVRDVHDPKHDQILAEKLRLAQEKIYLKGVKNGGMLGKRTKTFTEKEIRNLANMYLSGLTYEQLSFRTGIPKSTLQELIRSIPDSDLQFQIDAYVNKR